MITKEEPISLENLADGAAIERFDIELAKVLRAMADPNTAVKKHEVSLKVSLTPNDNDDFIKIDIEVHGKPAPPRGLTTTALLGRGPMPMAHELAPKQAPLFDNVKDLERRKS